MGMFFILPVRLEELPDNTGLSRKIFSPQGQFLQRFFHKLGFDRSSPSRALGLFTSFMILP
jgi:hypothetical protein